MTRILAAGAALALGATACAGRQNDALEGLSGDWGASTLAEALRGPGFVGSGNSVLPGVVGCGAPRYVGFTPWQYGEVHAWWSLRAQGGPAPLMIEILDERGATLHTDQALVTAIDAPDTTLVDVRVPYSALGTDTDKAREQTFVFRLTQTGAPCADLRFALHFPDAPLPY